MKKSVICILVCLIVLASGCLTVGIYAADKKAQSEAANTHSDLYQIEQVAEESSDEYFSKYRSNYAIDTEKMSVKDIIAQAIDKLTDLVFAGQVLLAELTISLFSFALSSDISVTLGTFLEPFVTALKGAMWDELSVFAIGIAAFLLLIYVVQNHTVKAISEGTALILVVTLALAFYAHPTQLLCGVDTLSSGVSDAVMEGAYQDAEQHGGGAKGFMPKSTALCWQLFVHKPWQVLEFGSVKMAERYQDVVLKLEPDSEERAAAIQELAESDHLFSKKIHYQLTRLFTALVLFLFDLLLMAILLTFSVLLLGYQFLIIIYLLLGGFIFLVALIPNFGLSLIGRWAGRVVNVAFTRVLVVFFLGISLTFMNVLYKFTDEYGLLTTIFLILVILVSIWIERYRILELFSAIKVSGGQFPEMMRRTLDQDFNAVDRMRSWKQVAGGFKDSTASGWESMRQKSTERRRQYQQTAEEKRYAADARIILRNKYNRMKKEAENFAGKKNKSGGGDPGAFVRRTEAVRKLGWGEFSEKDMTAAIEKLKGIDREIGNLDGYKKDAEAQLSKKYQNIKNVKDEISLEDQEFLERTDAVRALGNGKFHAQDVQKMCRQIQSKTEREWKAQRKSLIKMKSAEQPPVLKGIAFFRDNFGEEEGERRYETVVNRYGKDMTDQFDFDVPSSLDKRGRKQKLSYTEVLRQMEQRRKNAANQQAQSMRNSGEDL